MMPNIYFNNWIGGQPAVARALLILILFAAISQFASFALIQSHVISFYGAQPEDISFALQISYAGIITTLPIQFRLVKYFKTRNYLLAAFMAGILLNIGCLVTDDLVVFSVLRFFTGVVTCLIAGCMLIVIFTTLPEAKKIIVGTSLFFSLILTVGLIIGLGTSWVVLQADWTSVYYGLIGLQVAAMLLCVLMFKPRQNMKPYPLYQTDWIGGILFMFGSAATAFVMIYGPRRYWFDDPLMIYAAIFAAAMIGLFLYRQATLKRPLVDLRVFKSGKFIFALLLMVLFFGIKDTINLIYGYSASVLGWSAADVVHSGMYNIAGVVIATFIAVKVILANKLNLPKLLLAGFAVMLYYHLWVYQNLTPDLSLRELRIPIFLQGFGCGLLFVPITIFCLASAPAHTGFTGIVVCTYARFIAVLNSIAGFYTLQLNYNQHFKYSFLGKLIPGGDNLTQRDELYRAFLTSKGHAPGISTALIAKATAIQSQLLTIRGIFWIGVLLMAGALVVLVLFAVINKLKTAGATGRVVPA